MNRLFPRVLTLSALCSALLLAQASRTQLKLDSGKEIFEAACAGCHGSDGKGQPQALLGFQPPATFPDFADCPTATPEPDIQWRAIITNGGHARAFSPIMPSFREALTQDQIGKVIAHLRSLCANSGWALAEFNLPRPLYAEKAFPENESVLTSAVSLNKNGFFQTTQINEVRFSSKINMEFSFPFSFTKNPLAGGIWRGGIGDIAVEFKHRLYHNARTKTLIAGASEFNFPTGNPGLGTGNGVFVPEPFVSYEQLLPSKSYVMGQIGVRLPTHNDIPRRFFTRTVIGRSFSTEGGHGRTISPMIEWLSTRDYSAGNRTQWDVVPQVQITISQRQHIRVNAGVRTPINNYNNRPVQLAFYLLWDWFDGGFLEGWK